MVITTRGRAGFIVKLSTFRCSFTVDLKGSSFKVDEG